MKNLFYIVLILGFSGILFAMPPYPVSWDRLTAQEMSLVERTLNSAIQRGLERPARSILERMSHPLRDEPLEITIRVPVVLVDFADNIANRDEHTSAYYNALLFSIGQINTGSMREWYLENTLDNVHIIGDVFGWFRMPRTYAYYVSNQFGVGDYPRNTQRLAEDAIIASEQEIDFSRYDNDRDGVVDAFFVVHAGGGAEMEPNNRNKIWSHTWNIEQVLRFDGVRLFIYISIPEDAAIGVCAHEVGHALFGLPDLYDTQNRSAGLGFWSTMSYGAWGDEGRRPVHFDAWCKQRLGYANLRTLEFNDEILLPKIYFDATILRLWNPQNLQQEYFLAEYRLRERFDTALPGEGLLIYHIDESMADNDNPWYPDNQGRLHNLVALEQADGLWELERNRNRGDAGDPFPGSRNNRVFNAESNPNSLSYNGQNVGVSVSQIELRGDYVFARWEVGRARPEITRQVIRLRERWNMVSLRVVPINLDIITLMQSLVEDNNLLMVKDERGRFYIPAQDFCNIPQWNSAQGYMLKLRQPAEWIVDGYPIEPQTPINLNQGWRIVAYYPDYNLSPQVAFSNILNDISIVKDIDGNFYVPRLNFNNMPNLNPGCAYQIRINQNTILIYPRNE